MAPEELRIVARVLAKYRDSEARVDLGSAMAMITCDLSDVFRAEIPDFDYMGYWDVIEEERRTERARLDAWREEIRQRRENSTGRRCAGCNKEIDEYPSGDTLCVLCAEENSK